MRALALLPLLCCCSQQPAELSVVNGSELDSFDPQLATSAGSTRLLSAVFDCLTAIDPQTGKLRNELASNYSSSDNNRQWRFYLRPDARWSDGSKLTLIDVRDSWQRLQRPSTAAPYAGWLADATIEIVSGAVQLNFKSPQPLFATYCTYHALAPIPEVLRRATPGVIPENMTYSGPYKISVHRIRDFTRLSINGQHRDYSSASFPTIDFLSVDSQWTALNLYLDKQADYIPAVPQLSVEQLQQRHPAAISTTPSFATYFVRLQQSADQPLANRSLRMALALAVDRQQLVALIGGRRKPAHALVPDLLPDYSSIADISFNAAAAKAALQDAIRELGDENITIDYLYPASEINRTIAEFLQQQWQVVLGIKVSLNQLEAKSFFPLQKSKDYQSSHSTWIGDYYDPFTFLELFQSGHRNNRSSFSNADYDALLAESQSCTDPALRLTLLARAEKILIDEYAIIPLCFDSNIQLLRPNITGHVPNKFGLIEWQHLRREVAHD